MKRRSYWRDLYPITLFMALFMGWGLVSASKPPDPRSNGWKGESAAAKVKEPVCAEEPRPFSIEHFLKPESGISPDRFNWLSEFRFSLVEASKN